MLRGDNVCCGTSTNGTGTLSLAACPLPPGGIDFYQWLTATGLNFVNGDAVLVSYTINEYTDSSLATIKQTEKGVGTLTLGANLAASTLARTTVQATGPTGLAPLFSAPSAINVGNAANTLIFVGASSFETIALPPYTDTAANPDGTTAGFSPLMAGVSPVTGLILNNGFDIYVPFIWPRTMLAKRVSVWLSANYTGANSNLFARLYQTNSSARPGKLLYDFGVFGTANSSLVPNNVLIQTGAAGNGFLMTPGEYWMNLAPIWTAGGTGTPTIISINGGGYVQSGSLGSSVLRIESYALATAAVAVAPDPAELSSYTAVGSGANHPAFLISAS